MTTLKITQLLDGSHRTCQVDGEEADASIRTIKRRIGYDTEDDDIHDMRKSIVNMTMNVDMGRTG